MLPQLMRLGYRVFEGGSYRNNRPGAMASAAAQNGDAVQPAPLSEADAFNCLELPEVGSGEWRRSYEELSRAVRQRRADEFDKIALIKMQHQARFKSVIDHAHYFANKGRMVQIQNAAAYKQVNSVATAKPLLSRLQQGDVTTGGEQSAEVARPVLPGHLLAEELFNALHAEISFESLAKTLTLERPLSKLHAKGQWAGVEFVQYRWYPDVMLDNIFWHDHTDVIHGWAHGLVGQFIVEPPGSTYHDPVTGKKVDSGTIVDIRTNSPLAPGAVSGSVTRRKACVEDE